MTRASGQGFLHQAVAKVVLRRDKQTMVTTTRRKDRK